MTQAPKTDDELKSLTADQLSYVSGGAKDQWIRASFTVGADTWVITSNGIDRTVSHQHGY
jgi:hypothetical protein